jgi:hypothetical protein
MVYPNNPVGAAFNVTLDPAKHSGVLNTLTNLEQAIAVLDGLSGAGDGLRFNFLTHNPVEVQGNWQRAYEVTHLLAGHYNNIASGQDGDAVELDILVPSAGVYTLFMNAAKNVDAPIVKLYMDGVQIGVVGGYDLRAGALAPVNIISVAALALTAGKHTFKIAADGKNALATAYIIRLQAVEFVRTA